MLVVVPVMTWVTTDIESDDEGKDDSDESRKDPNPGVKIIAVNPID